MGILIDRPAEKKYTSYRSRKLKPMLNYLDVTDLKFVWEEL